MYVELFKYASLYDCESLCVRMKCGDAYGTGKFALKCAECPMRESEERQIELRNLERFSGMEPIMQFGSERSRFGNCPQKTKGSHAHPDY